MINVIISLKSNIKDKIATILSRDYNILPYAKNGAEIMQIIQRIGGKGIIICTSNLSDMNYTHLRSLIDNTYKILVIKTSGSAIYETDINSINLPFTQLELLKAVELLAQDSEDIISCAKKVLMQERKISEGQAYKLLRDKSMQSRIKIEETAKHIVERSIG